MHKDVRSSMPKFASIPTDLSMTATTLSADGFIRLTYERFLRIRLEHLCSGLDDTGGHTRLSAEGAYATAIAGYTEWVSAGALSQPVVTIGWSWALVGACGGARCIPVDVPGHNLMFLDSRGNDLGLKVTTYRLQNWLQQFDWQPQVLSAVGAVRPS